MNTDQIAKLLAFFLGFLTKYRQLLFSKEENAGNTGMFGTV
jgi:hypothetical protein